VAVEPAPAAEAADPAAPSAAVDAALGADVTPRVMVQSLAYVTSHTKRSDDARTEVPVEAAAAAAAAVVVANGREDVRDDVERERREEAEEKEAYDDEAPKDETGGGDTAGAATGRIRMLVMTGGLGPRSMVWKRREGKTWGSASASLICTCSRRNFYERGGEARRRVEPEEAGTCRGDMNGTGYRRKRVSCCRCATRARTTRVPPKHSGQRNQPTCKQRPQHLTRRHIPHRGSRRRLLLFGPSRAPFATYLNHQRDVRPKLFEPLLQPRCLWGRLAAGAPIPRLHAVATAAAAKAILARRVEAGKGGVAAARSGRGGQGGSSINVGLCHAALGAAPSTEKALGRCELPAGKTERVGASTVNREQTV